MKSKPVWISGKSGKRRELSGNICSDLIHVIE